MVVFYFKKICKVKYYLQLAIAFLTMFSLSDNKLSLTYGDIVLPIVFLLFIRDVINKKIRLERFGRYFMYFVILLLFTGIVNSTFLDGPFLNIFKTSLISLVFYLWSYSLVYRNKLNGDQFVIGIGLFSIVFILLTWPQMQQAWSMSSLGFTNYQVFDSSLNLNTWGYMVVLFLVISLYGWSNNIFKKLSIIGVFIFSFFIILSFSRSAYALTIFSFLWVLIFVQKLNIKKILFPVVVLFVLFIFLDGISYIQSFIPDSANQFWERKANNAQNDLIETRFYLINIFPIKENFSTFNFFQLIFGDGVSVQHSWISNSLVVTGIIGFFVYYKRFSIGFYKSLKSNIYTNSSVNQRFLFLVLLLTIVNDFITNLTLFLPIAGYLTYIIVAFFMAQLDLSKRYETKFDISDRV